MVNSREDLTRGTGGGKLIERVCVNQIAGLTSTRDIAFGIKIEDIFSLEEDIRRLGLAARVGAL
jgi:hypothetical protein